jgi:hypothetical protein
MRFGICPTLQSRPGKSYDRPCGALLEQIENADRIGDETCAAEAVQVFAVAA